MVYTITFNPSIDYVAFLDKYETGVVNRSSREQLYPGGKGLNVSIVLSNLGIDTTALGFLAGTTGEVISRLLSDYTLKTDFVKLNSGFSRINVKLKADSETEINGSGPDITHDALQLLFGKLSLLKTGDWLVLAGSVPSTLDTGIYGVIMDMVSCKGVRVVVDATAELLTDSLKFSPFLIKPNNFELEEIFGCKMKSEDDIINSAVKLQKMGATNVLVSLGKEGAVLLDENGNIHKRPAPLGEVINTTGSGDSMVAGFIAGYTETADYEYALRFGIASGSASAFSEGLATKEQIFSVMK